MFTSQNQSEVQSQFPDDACLSSLRMPLVRAVQDSFKEARDALGAAPVAGLSTRGVRTLELGDLGTLDIRRIDRSEDALSVLACSVSDCVVRSTSDATLTLAVIKDRAALQAIIRRLQKEQKNFGAVFLHSALAGVGLERILVRAPLPWKFSMGRAGLLAGEPLDYLTYEMERKPAGTEFLSFDGIMSAIRSRVPAGTDIKSFQERHDELQRRAEEFEKKMLSGELQCGLDYELY